MDKNIQNFIDKKKQELEKLRASKKRDFLIQQGLYEKVYAPDHHNVDTDEYPHKVYNKKKNSYMYYKIVVSEISDDDYKKLLKVCNFIEEEKQKVADTDQKEEPVGKPIPFISMLMFFATAIIFIAGIIATVNDSRNAVLYIFSAFVSGCLFIALGKIIELLSRNK